jgi:hypothetical protein
MNYALRTKEHFSASATRSLCVKRDQGKLEQVVTGNLAIQLAIQLVSGKCRCFPPLPFSESCQCPVRKLELERAH